MHTITTCPVLLLLLAAVVSLSVALPANPLVLEVNGHPWLYQLSQQYRRTVDSLAAVPDAELRSIKARGVDMIWVQGVWLKGAYGLHHDKTDAGLLSSYARLNIPNFNLDKDVIGSPFAIVNYTCSPVFCTSEDDLQAFRQRLHSFGLMLVLDFVPNHSAIDSPLVNSSTDLYIRAPRGVHDSSRYIEPVGVAYGRDPWSGAWTDVAQLNCWNPKTREMMIDNMMRVAAVSDVLRCDMAHLVLNSFFQQTWNTELSAWGWTRPAQEFWFGALQQVKQKYPDTLFLAEVYGQDQATALQAQGFDWAYDKDLLDRLKDGNLDNLRAYISWQASAGKIGMWSRFVENHDEDRSASTLGFPQRAALGAALCFTMPGLRFVYQDQWRGYKNKMEIHLLRAAPEADVPESLAFFKTLFSIIQLPALQNGEWNICNPHDSDESWRLISWRWSDATTGQKVLVVINYSSESAEASIAVPDVSGSGYVTITELVSGVKYSRSAEMMRNSSQGLGVVVDAWAMQVFLYP